MNREKEILIREKTETLFRLERSLQALGMMNTCGESFDELKKHRIEYEILKAKVFEAEQELLVAQKL